MKYIIVLCDGMADEPLEELGGKTPLQFADTPHMDRLAPHSELGMVRTVPAGMVPGSDTANLSVAGYDPLKYYTGRSPLEALSIGAEMEDGDVSFRCNLVTLTQDEEAYEDKTIIDHSADEISTEDAVILLDALKTGLKKDGYIFYNGTSYRHLLIQKDGKVKELTAPHDILMRPIREYLPKDVVLRDMMEKSYKILSVHPLNRERERSGKNPANSAWFWGAGTRPSLPAFEKKFQKRGAMISAVDLLKGIAAGTGMHIVNVPGANGGLHTNYGGKACKAAEVLVQEGYDFVYVHIEAPDEMGHQGCVKHKVLAIENIDKKIVGPLVEALDKAGETFRMMILPDHPTPVRIRTHTGDPVPYMLYDSTVSKKGSPVYDEETAKATGCRWEQGEQLISHLFGEIS